MQACIEKLYRHFISWRSLDGFIASKDSMKQTTSFAQSLSGTFLSWQWLQRDQTECFFFLYFHSDEIKKTAGLWKQKQHPYAAHNNFMNLIFE